MRKKWAFIGAISLALLLALVLASAGTQTVRAADSTFYVDDDYTDATPGWGVDHFATITAAIDAASPGDTILVAAGTYYEEVEVDKQLTLTGDVDQPSNVVLNAGGSDNVTTLSADGCVFQGFTVQNGTHGIYLDNSNNSTVTGNTASSNSKHGIYLDESDNNTLTGNTASSNSEHGIYLDSQSISNTLTGNTAELNSRHGIYLDKSDNNTLTGNTASSNTEYGIYLDNSDSNTLTGNTAELNSRHGIYLNGNEGSNGNTLDGNTANQNSEHGIHLDRSSNNTLTSNTANLNTNYGIYLASSSSNTLTSNTASSNTQHGIYFTNSSNNNILTSNTANLNTEYGIYLSESGSNNLTGNAMSGNSYNFYVVGSSVSHYVQTIDTTNTVDGKPVYYLVGVSGEEIGASTNAGYVGVVNSTNVTVKDLTLTKGGQGVLFAYTSQSSIENVTVSNSYYGIYLTNSSNNTLTSNTASSNTQHGIYFTNSSNNNTFTSNSVTGNNIGVKIQPSVDASTISLNFNQIYSNTQYGVENSGSGTADATNHWWGDISGPTHASNPTGTGDALSNNVSYDPWHLKQITDLAANNATGSSIDLFWTTTGAWDSDYFDVRYSTSTITSGNWNDASRATGEPTPSTTCNTSQGMRVSGLSLSTTYYFGLKLTDGDIDSSEISNIASATTLAVAPIDTTPPSAITDLAASAGTPSTAKVILSWTAKGDDRTDGIASQYIIKRSTSSITAVNFDSATTVYNNVTPKANGDNQSFTVSKLTANTTYYFAIKIQDEAPNTSAISNVVSITTSNLLPTVTGISPTTADNGQARTLTITGTNFVSSGTTVVRLINNDNTFALTSVTYVSPTQLTAVVPQGAPTGTYQARVINDNGTSALSSATYIVSAAVTPLPSVTNLIPQMAVTNTAASGVQIFGENLTGATAVNFGDTAATSFTVISDTKITADVPGLTAGEYDVKVTTAAGTNGISTVKFRVSDPVVINSASTEDITTSEAINLVNTSVIPVEVTLTTDTSETAIQATDTDASIEVVIPPRTAVATSDGTAYTGNINPPRVVKPDESILTNLAENALVMEMGNPDETLRFDQEFVATIIVSYPVQPLIWYYNKDTGAYELAGITGTKDGIDYVTGGTKLGQEDDIYTMGVLLDHMSPFVAGVKPRIISAPLRVAVGNFFTVEGVNFHPTASKVYFGGDEGTISPRTSTTEIVVSLPGPGDLSLKVENPDGLFDTAAMEVVARPGGGVAPPAHVRAISPPGVVAVSHFVTANGIFTRGVVAGSFDELCQLTIPRGTEGLTKDKEPLSQMTITEMIEPPPPPEDAYAIGSAYDIGPPGATFDPTITLTIKYDPARLPQGVAEEDLYIAYWDGSKWVAQAGTVGTEANTLSCELSHFTVFAVIGAVTLPPVPAAFSVSDLSIQPAEVEPQEAVTIIVSVANTGGTEGSYTVVLDINGVEEAEKSVTVAAGGSESVSFSVTREEAGSYTVAVGGLNSSFIVGAPAPPPAPPAPPLSWILIGGIIAGVMLLGGLVIFLLVQRRAY